jgi:hypothetical protein
MSTEHTEPAGLSDEELLQIAEDSCMDLFKRKRRDPDGIAIEEGYWEAWDHQLLAFARAVEAATLARAQRQPVPPEPEEVQELVGLIRQIALAWEPDATLLGNMTAGQLARAADLLESLSPPQPVPVSERLPGPGVKVLAHYLNALGKGRTVCAIWVPAKSRTDDGDLDSDDFLEYDEEDDKFYWPEGWYEAIENWEELGWVKIYEGEIVYWQPLPQWPAHALPLPVEVDE